MIGSRYIATQKRTCGMCPEQYEGTLVDGRTFYLRMRWGAAELGIGTDIEAEIEDTWSTGSDVRTVVDQDGLRGYFEDDEERNAVFGALLALHPRGVASARRHHSGRPDMSNFRVGDAVECRTAHGDWFGAVVAGPVRNVRYGKAYKLAIAITGGGWTNVNWPVSDVRIPGGDTTASGGKR